ncbi:MAG TPA: DUF1003 domain-containing protein [Iamia sp.]
MARRPSDLSRPRRRLEWTGFYDPDAFGRFSEGIARFLGTGRFLMGQTIIVFIWITINVTVAWARWDEYPFILLNLAFSTQAAYAAPLILLAQNRQDDRDRRQAELDRQVNNRTQADTEYLARELASVRIALGDVVTTADLRDSVDRVAAALERVEARLAALEADRAEPSPAEAP